jgi:hypothetical protein
MGFHVFALLLVMVLASAPSAIRAENASHRTAAEALLEAANTRNIMQETLEQSVEIQIRNKPELAPFRQVMKTFMAKHLGYEALKDDLAVLFMAEFTEKDLKQITAFYRTPTGRKSLEKTPVLFQKGAELGMKRVQQNLPELERMIEEYLAKNPSTPKK